MKKKGPAADSKLPPTFSPGPARPPFRLPEFRDVTVANPDPLIVLAVGSGSEATCNLFFRVRLD